MSAPVAADLLRFRSLLKTKSDGQPLLEIEDFPIPIGGCMVLSGRNGAGKTTLLKIIAGLETPDRADVELGGTVLPWHQARRRYACDVIYLHQQPYLFDRSVADNVGFGLQVAGLRRAEIARRVSQALEIAALSHLGMRNARELSGGEKQRVALTRALVLAPRLLLLDEPLASLDEDSRVRTLALIRELKTQRIAVVLTTHERLSLAMIANAYYELSGGSLEALSESAESIRAVSVVRSVDRSKTGRT